MNNQLLPCPFCGGDANAKPHSQHLPGCYFDAMASLKAAPRGDLSMAPEVIRAWNRRANQPAAGEPVAWANARDLSGQGYEFTVSRDGGPNTYWSAPLYAAPLSAVHGDEAVLWELLEELRTATDRQALPGEFIRVMWEAGCDWINARAAMRAQGDGEVQ